VFGIYGDAAFGRKQDSISHLFEETRSIGPPAANAQIGESITEIGLRLNNSYAVIARAGFLANPSTLFYGLVGYTWHDYHAWSTVDDGGLGQTFTATKSGYLG